MAIEPVIWVLIGLVLITGIVLLAPVPERLSRLFAGDKVKQHLRTLKDRHRVLRIYLWVVAGFALVAVIVQLASPLGRLIADLTTLMTNRSEDFYRDALWPGVVLILLLVFGKAMIRVLRDATVESITVGTSGVSMKFGRDDLRLTLDELTKELTDPANGLDEPAKKLFKDIYASNGRDTVGVLIPGFKRESEAHERLRHLRRLNLIIPAEGRSWDKDKHPVVTGFGRAVYPHIDRLPSVPRTEGK
ncbi:hypothetical protein [Geodermatophilus obscurus]|uniref:hypothetical protein n=1 Tax=Geodermatophilus obscurus TaxID=1861 RepID=UPI0009429EFA|nr:hypothetical protein [Geodermatophilus obscurus]